MTDDQIEQEIQTKGLTAPRLTPADIDAVIMHEQYHVFPGTTFTACLLTLENGYAVLGESACASPENFNAEIGRKIARDNARNKIWALEGYLLRQRLEDESQHIDLVALYAEKHGMDAVDELFEQLMQGKPKPLTEALMSVHPK